METQTRIPMSRWGGDHWSTLLYLETCAVDHQGSVRLTALRGHRERRPAQYPTRLNDGTEVANHDDFDCMDDMVAEGLIELVRGHFEVRLTDLGWQVVSALRQHRAEGLLDKNFRWPR